MSLSPIAIFAVVFAKIAYDARRTAPMTENERDLAKAGFEPATIHGGTPGDARGELR